jgi:uncharacterized C2H2 Zn-finger protein
MKFPFSRTTTVGFVCKQCKMTFTSKEALERHKNKAKHFGDIHF